MDNRLQGTDDGVVGIAEAAAPKVDTVLELTKGIEVTGVIEGAGQVVVLGQFEAAFPMPMKGICWST